MAKLVFIFCFFLLSFAQAKSLQLELVGQTSLPIDASIGGSKIGGLSGIHWNGEKLIAVSDDRGKFGSPRYFEFELKIEPKADLKAAGKSDPKADATVFSSSVELKPKSVTNIKTPDRAWVLDLEALVNLGKGELLFSTEGDTNTKPRAMPHLFVLGSDGKLKHDLEIPEKFLPERLGQQKRGIENNRGFEGVTITQDQSHLFAVTETPIVSDSVVADCHTLWVRIIDFTKSSEEAPFKPKAELAYPIEKYRSDERGPEMFRGISEILAFDSEKIIVLERGARLTSKGIGYTGGIYLYDMSHLKDVSKMVPLCTPTQISGKKELLVDLAAVLKTDRLENFEGLAWGPTLPDGRRSLLVVSDNNFSSRERTQLLVFAVKEVP